MYSELIPLINDLIDQYDRVEHWLAREVDRREFTRFQQMLADELLADVRTITGDLHLLIDEIIQSEAHHGNDQERVQRARD